MEKLPRFFVMVFCLVPFLVAWSPPVAPPSDSAPEKKAEKQKVLFDCQSTGEFNVAPNGESVSMETWCRELHPKKGKRRSTRPVADRAYGKARNSKGPANMFNVPFERTTVSVEKRGGRFIVKLHYRDDKGVFHDLRLRPQKGRKYEYDFSKLVLDPSNGKITIRAESEERWMEP